MSTGNQADGAFPAGTVLDDRFELEARLGAGNFSTVYRAQQLIFGIPWRRVALKLFESEKVNAENARDVFNDAIVLMGLQGEHVHTDVTRHLIQVYDIGLLRTPKPRAFMAMKLIPGGRTLEHAVRRWREAGGMPVATALKFLRQLLVPLAWMHTLDTPVAHGDLKPDNILLVADEELVITDFGLAACMPVGSFGGAIEYQAPETLAGMTIQLESDIYALGVILYELLTGHHPFEGVGLEHQAANDTRAYVNAHRLARRWPLRAAVPGDPEHGGRVRPAVEINRELSEHPHVEAMLAKCLAEMPSGRYRNARLMLSDLDTYLTGGGADLHIDVPTPSASTPVAFDQDTAATLVAKATSLLAQGRAHEALEKARAATDLDKGCVPAILAAARAQAALGCQAEAQALCLKAQKLAPLMAEAFETHAGIIRDKQPGLARALLQKATQLRGGVRRG
jgi:serine/threonine protein kinase